MANFLDKLILGAKQYTLFDFAMLKLALLSTGILLGTYFSDLLTIYLPAIWIIAIFCGLVIISTTLVKAFGKKKHEKSGKKHQPK